MTKQDLTIALAGNPNSGKTTLFNQLTGANQYIGNWPGVTVEKKKASSRGIRRSLFKTCLVSILFPQTRLKNASPASN